MKAYEFPVKVMPGGTIQLPAPLSEQIPKNQHVRVIILVNDPENAEERADWNRLTSEQFLAGYSNADEAYDRI
ncbi:MAG: hypothetical protein BWK80_56825 [Desulfobacteraceae bacterium IS3]|nr:MAG: hypothetical protein BWK80_56825 [Desulfobacteraceae bacterium IS3]